MSNITPVASFDSVPRLETATPALAGSGGPMTAQAQALTNRDAFLKTETDAHTAVIGNTGIAADARNKLGLGDLVIAYNARGAWVTATAYALNDVVVQSSVVYQCTLAHTSGTFATDVAAGKWAYYQGARLADLAGSNGDGLIGHGSRTVKAVLDEQINVVSKGADPTGTASSLAGFQAAIDATPDGTTQLIHVPRGIYKGDMSTLVQGTRTIIWAEEAGVSYPDQFPSATRSSVRSLPPALFAGSIVPMRHLRAFGCRRAGVGSGAVPGTVSFSGGGVSAIATGMGGANYSASTTRVLISGDGSGAKATPTITSGVITGYTIDAAGTGYTVANVYVVDGPVVVVVGDSICTEDPTPANPKEDQYTLLRSAISQANQRRNITYFNRAIGAQTFTTFNGVANANWPAWYSNTSRAWIDYIAELQPDLIMVAFGMNDAQNFVFSQFTAAMAKLAALAPKPDVVLCTPMVPSAISADTSMSSADSQNGRSAVAGYLRGFALTNGLGLVDLNRQLRLVRDGVDVRNSALRDLGLSGTQTLPWVASVTGGDFYLSATFSSLGGGFWTGRTIDWVLGMSGPNTRTICRIDDNAGYLRVLVRDQDPDTPAFYTNQFVVTTGVATPTSGSLTLAVSMLDNRLEVMAGATTLYVGMIPRFSGIFAPSIETASTTAVLACYVGEFAQYPQRLTDWELWGYGSGKPYKGNALNHPSSVCVKYVMAPVIHGANWAASALTQGASIALTTTNHGIGEPAPLAPLHITKDGHSTDITPISNASNLVLEDELAPGLSMLSGPSGVARINWGDSDDAAKFATAYLHTDDSFVEIFAGTTTRKVYAGKELMYIPAGVPSYTVAGLPSATGTPTLVFVSNEAGGAVVAFNDGSNWRRVTDRAIVS